MTEKNQRGEYILQAMNKIHLSGDSYTDIQTLFNNCMGYSDSIGLQNDLMTLCSKGILLLDGDKVSTAHIASCETTAALHLAEILQNNMIERPIPFTSIAVNGHELSAEQRRAISISLSHRLSLIIGGAGTGKTSLIQGTF